MVMQPSPQYMTFEQYLLLAFFPKGDAICQMA